MLHWARGGGADDCATQEDVIRDVVSRLGRTLEDTPIALRIDGFVESVAGAWSARIYTRDARGMLLGQRTIAAAAPSCRSLDSAVGLAIALAIDPGLERAPAPAPSALATNGPPTTDAPLAPMPGKGDPAALATSAPASVETRSQTARAASHGPSLTLATALSDRLVPGLRPEVLFEVHTPLFGPAHLSLGGTYAPESRTHGTASEFGFGLGALHAGLCYRTSASRVVQAQGCLGAEVGELVAVVYTPVPAGPGGRPWGAIRARLGLGFALVGPLRLEVSAMARAPLVRWQYRVENHDALEFQQPTIIPSGRIGLEVRLP